MNARIDATESRDAADALKTLLLHEAQKLGLQLTG